MSYELLPGTPEKLEEQYRNSRVREKECSGCNVQCESSLDYLRNYCYMGLCPEEE